MSTLAIDGGTPVRTKPFPAWPIVSEEIWDQRVGPRLRQIFLSRTEGLPNPQSRAFEAAFGGYLGVAHALLTSHGTDALQALVAGALDADGLGRAGEVICPNYTFIASAAAPLALQTGICFVDVDRDTCNLDPAAVEAAVGPETVGIMAVHLGGQAADMDALQAICDQHGLRLMEDCAQAHGAKYGERHVGSLCDGGAYSFQSSKNLTSGEGGLVTSNNADIYNKAFAYMNIGRFPGGERWEHPRLGWNFRGSEYLAALLNARFETFDDEANLRDDNGRYLDRLLADIDGFVAPKREPWCTRHAYHLYMAQYLPEAFGGKSRDQFLRAMGAEGIPVSAGYNMLLSDQEGIEMVRQDYPDRLRVMPCPNTEYILAHSVWLFQSVLLGTHEDMDDIAAAVHKIQTAWTS